MKINKAKLLASLYKDELIENIDISDISGINNKYKTITGRIIGYHGDYSIDIVVKDSAPNSAAWNIKLLYLVDSHSDETDIKDNKVVTCRTSNKKYEGYKGAYYLTKNMVERYLCEKWNVTPNELYTGVPKDKRVYKEVHGEVHREVHREVSILREICIANLGREVYISDIDCYGMVVGYDDSSSSSNLIIGITSEKIGWTIGDFIYDIVLIHSPLILGYWYINSNVIHYTDGKPNR